MTYQVDCCDFCDSGKSCYDKCLNCGKAACWTCKEIFVTIFQHSLYCGNTDNVVFCNDCVAKLDIVPTSIYSLYKSMAYLIQESQMFNKQMTERSKLIENKISEERGRSRG